MGIHTEAIIEGQREAVITALDKMAVPGSAGSDEYMNAFAPAMAGILLRHEFDDVMSGILEIPEEPERRAHKFMRAIQRPLMRYIPSHVMDLPQARHLEEEDIEPHPIAYKYDYPSDEFKDVDHWDKVIREEWEDERLRIDFFVDNRLRTLQTNRASRGKGLKLPLVAYANRFPNPTIVDIGASQNQIGKQLVLSDKYPYSYTKAGVFTGHEKEMDVNALDTYMVNKALELPSNVSEVHGYDIHRESHIEWLLWARACWRPSDLANKTLMEQYDALAEEIPPNISYGSADFSKPFPECFETFGEAIPQEKFDVAFISTMIHQFPYSEQPKVLKTAEDLVQGEGVVALQDFFIGEVDPHQPHATHEIYHPDAKYLLLTKDMTVPQEGYTIFGEWDGGSCNKFELHSGRTALAQCFVD